VGAIDLGTADDRRILDHAIENGFTILTKDRDFADWVLVHGAPPKVVWIRAGNCSTKDLAQIIEDCWADIDDFHGDAGLALLVVPLAIAVG
jgi:predicted nuclease of predicted toxin-antitoxin system